MCICSGNLGKASKGLQVIASSSSTEEEEMKWLHWTFSRLYFKEGNTALGKEEFLKESHLQKGWIHELV